LIIHLIIQTILLYPSGAIWTDGPPNLSRLDPSGAVQVDAEFNQQQLEHGAAPVSLWSFVTSSEFWFQSLQNWQSEFLAVAALTVLGIFLRQRGSPESKPVAAPHAQTGSS
jgi:hypothetical protein